MKFLPLIHISDKILEFSVSLPIVLLKMPLNYIPSLLMTITISSHNYRLHNISTAV